MSLRQETLNDFASSWPETQALNLDFMRPSQSNRELTVSSWPETQALNLDFMRPSQSSREFTASDS